MPAGWMRGPDSTNGLVRRDGASDRRQQHRLDSTKGRSAYRALIHAHAPPAVCRSCGDHCGHHHSHTDQAHSDGRRPCSATEMCSRTRSSGDQAQPEPLDATGRAEDEHREQRP